MLVSNNGNKVHQTWQRPHGPALHNITNLLLLPLGPAELLRLDVRGPEPAVARGGPAPECEGHVDGGDAVDGHGDDVRRQHDQHVVPAKPGGELQGRAKKLHKLSALFTEVH